MPFIRGRYYANPVAGHAIESAREADDAVTASRGSDDADRNGYGDQDTNTKAVREIVIEVAELVPSHSGRTTTGYVAHLRRNDSKDSNAQSSKEGTPAEKRVFYDPGQLAAFLKNELTKNGSCR